MLLSIIIPIYNLEKYISKCLDSIIGQLNDEIMDEIEIILVNDGSTDRTKDILECNDIPHIDLIHNLGIGGAVQTGYRYAYYNDYDIAIQYDGDGQHNVRYVKDIIEPIINKKADMVIGSRFVSNIDTFKSTFVRRIGIKVISIFMKLTTGKKIYDTTSGFRACSKSIIYDFSRSYPNEYPEPITTAEIIRKKYKVVEVPVEMNEREGGESSIKTWKSLYYMLNVCIALLVIRIRRYR